MFVAAEEPLASDARFRAWQVHAAMCAAHQLAVDRRLARDFALLAAGQRSLDEPDRRNHDYYKDKEPAHRSIIYRRAV